MKKRSALTVYAYVMLGVSGFMCACGVIVVSVASIALTRPEILLTEGQELRYGHNDNYREWLGEAGASLTEDEVTLRREEAKQVALDAASQEGRERLLLAGVMALVFGFVAWLHWRLIRRQRLGGQTPGNSPGN